MYIIIRTGDSRGFAFVRYKYQDEAQKAVEKLDGMSQSFNFGCFYFCRLFSSQLFILVPRNYLQDGLLTEER